VRCWGTNGSASLGRSAKHVRSESGGQSIRSGFGNASERYDFAKAKNSSSLISFRSLLRIGSPGCLPRLLLWDWLVNGVRSTGVPMLAPEKLFGTAFFTVGAVIVLLHRVCGRVRRLDCDPTTTQTTLTSEAKPIP
jgi:hypothetical protein